jgi:hypothetical protein
LEVVTEVLLEQKKIEGRFGKKTLMVCVPSRTMEVWSAKLSSESRGRRLTNDDDSSEPTDQTDATSSRSPFPPPSERPKDIAALPAFFRSGARGPADEVREGAEEVEFAEEEVGVQEVLKEGEKQEKQEQEGEEAWGRSVYQGDGKGQPYVRRAQGQTSQRVRGEQVMSQLGRDVRRSSRELVRVGPLAALSTSSFLRLRQKVMIASEAAPAEYDPKETRRSTSSAGASGTQERRRRREQEEGRRDEGEDEGLGCWWTGRCSHGVEREVDWWRFARWSLEGWRRFFC